MALAGRAQAPVAKPEAQTIAVRGAAEDTAGAPVAGVRLEFLLPGSSERKSAVTGADGKYSLDLPAGPYEIQLSYPGQAHTESQMAYLGPAERKEVVINARIPKEKFAEHLEYDFLGEWRVVNERGRGIGPAQVTFEALQRDGRRARFPVYVPTMDEEKETDGKMETDPAGRFAFRIREMHLLPEKVVALVVTAEMPGYLPHSERIFPALQFSETGHLYENFPEEGVKIVLKPR